MSEIYDLSVSYKLGKKYVVKSFKNFYGKYIVTGQKNIPAQGPVIFAPNHVNALMDALAVLSITPDNFSTSFLARADLFNNHFLIKPLNFIKIMPAFRIRDGYENLGKNAEVFNKCVELLDKGNALCLMPEGNQEIEKFIRPLVKGIFRIAFQAQQQIGTEKSVKIVPVGIDIEHLIKYGKHIIINIGEPINVLDYMKEYSENQAYAIKNIKDRLYADLCRLTLNLQTKDYYEEFELLTEVGANLKKTEKSKVTFDHFKTRQQIAERLKEIEKNEPEKLSILIELSHNLKTKFQQYKIRISNLTEKNNYFQTAIKFVLLIIGIPFFLTGFLLNFLPFFLPVYIRKLMKIKFEGFYSSVHFASAILLTFPLFYLLQTTIFALVTQSYWWQIILFFVSQHILGKLAFFWYKKFRATVAGLRILKLRQSDEYIKIKKMLEDIEKILN